MYSGADINARGGGKDSPGNTPLIEAVLAGGPGMVRLLAHLPNMDLNRGDIFHASPLAHAVQRDRWDLAEILVEAGANLNIQRA